MTRIIYVVYTKEYLTSRQIIGANLKKYAFLCDYSEVKIIQVNGVNPMILAMAEDGIDMKDLMILQMI